MFGLILTFVLNEFFPGVRFTSLEGQVVGGIVILIGLVLLVTANGLFTRAGTDVIPFRDVTALVTSGRTLATFAYDDNGKLTEQKRYYNPVSSSTNLDTATRASLARCSSRTHTVPFTGEKLRALSMTFSSTVPKRLVVA